MSCIRLRMGKRTAFLAVSDPDTVRPQPGTTRLCAHTPCPDGYMDRHEWARRMLKTHVQQRCPGCGLWAVWVEKEPAAPRATRRAVAKALRELAR